MRRVLRVSTRELLCCFIFEYRPTYGSRRGPGTIQTFVEVLQCPYKQYGEYMSSYLYIFTEGGDAIRDFLDNRNGFHLSRGRL